MTIFVVMDRQFKITFLGTGTSHGVPVIACNCDVCSSDDPRDKRLRASILVETGDKTFVVDTGPDFRQQMLRAGVRELTAILFTHEHRDHVAGLDDVRAFNFIQHKKMDVYAEKRIESALKHQFDYIFSEDKYPGIPEINLHEIDEKPFSVEGIEIIPIRVYHHKLPVLGFRFGDFAYLTDVKTIPEKEKEKLRNLRVLVLTCLRKEPHISHLNLEEALLLAKELKPGMTYLTHMSHRFGRHASEQLLLPENVAIAYDGLQLTV